jgi:hypothetical protein
MRSVRLLLAALGVAFSSFAAATPAILAAAEDDGELLIIGRGFGPSPSVRLGELPLTVRGSTDVVIRATLPSVGIEPGSYALTVWRNALPRMPSEPFHVTLGAVGPRGEKGDKGDKGDPGVLGSFDQVAGMPCTLNGVRGRVSVSFVDGGEIRLRCEPVFQPIAPAAKRD